MTNMGLYPNKQIGQSHISNAQAQGLMSPTQNKKRKSDVMDPYSNMNTIDSSASENCSSTTLSPKSINTMENSPNPAGSSFGTAMGHDLSGNISDNNSHTLTSIQNFTASLGQSHGGIGLNPLLFGQAAGLSSTSSLAAGLGVGNNIHPALNTLNPNLSAMTPVNRPSLNLNNPNRISESSNEMITVDTPGSQPETPNIIHYNAAHHMEVTGKSTSCESIDSVKLAGGHDYWSGVYL